jgi:phosphatidate cytidylyltransferase
VGGAFFAALLLLTYAIAMLEWMNLSRKAGLFIPLFGGGFFYLTTSFLLFYHLRDLPEKGLALVVMAFFCVWASDSLAYIFGKIFKGRRLAPKISPNKTYAGLIGAMIGPIFILILGDIVMDAVRMTNIQTNYLYFIVFGSLLGCVGQTGDLLISILKRKAGVKDTGTLIPGHGGLLDRIDSLLLIVPVFYLMERVLPL